MKETVNRFEEEIITTSNLSEMKDKYLAEPYTMTLLSAKKMKVEAVIDHVFCNEYIDRSKGKGEQAADND